MLSARMIVFVFVALYYEGGERGGYVEREDDRNCIRSSSYCGGWGGGYVEREDDRVCIRSSSYYYFHTR